MKKLTSILVVIDPLAKNPTVVGKAVTLARHFGAKVELFLCDAEHAYALRHAYDSTGAQQARQACIAQWRHHLESLRQSVLAEVEGVEISVSVACESPLYEGIVHRVLASHPDLVIKSTSGAHRLRRFSMDANDWQLARTCPTPVMFTCGRPWTDHPRFAAAVDVTEQETAGLAQAILHTAEYLSLGCHAELDVLYSERHADDALKAQAHAAALGEITGEHRVPVDHVHALAGDPEQTLPAFASSRHYDVLVLGALTHRKNLTALVGTLTGKLVDTLDCDFVLVKPDDYRCPVEESVQPASVGLR